MKRRNFLLGMASLPALLLPRWLEGQAKPLPPRMEPISVLPEPTPPLIWGATPRWTIYTGGPGAGKTFRLISRTLDLLRDGNDGVLLAPTWERMRKCTWPDLQRQLPHHWVVSRRLAYGEMPRHQLDIFNKRGGISRLLLTTLDHAPYGFNAHFVAVDDARRENIQHDMALKFLDGRARVKGHNGSNPQLMVTSEYWPNSPGFPAGARVVNLEEEYARRFHAHHWTFGDDRVESSDLLVAGKIL